MVPSMVSEKLAATSRAWVMTRVGRLGSSVVPPRPTVMGTLTCRWSRIAWGCWSRTPDVQPGVAGVLSGCSRASIHTDRAPPTSAGRSRASGDRGCTRCAPTTCRWSRIARGRWRRTRDVQPGAAGVLSGCSRAPIHKDCAPPTSTGRRNASSWSWVHVTRACWPAPDVGGTTPATSDQAAQRPAARQLNCATARAPAARQLNCATARAPGARPPRCGRYRCPRRRTGPGPCRTARTDPCPGAPRVPRTRRPGNRACARRHRAR